MDDLLQNFPHMFPKKPDIRTVAKETHSLIFEGERGVANDEATTPSEVELCNQAFLDSILSKLRFAELKVWMYANRSGGHHMHNPLRHDPERYIRENFALIFQLLTEITRLGQHQELFRDLRQRNQFFAQASKTLRFAQKLYGLTDQVKVVVTCSQKRVDDWTSSHPMNPRTGKLYQPWESFGRAMPLLENSAAVQEIQELVPDMRLITAQQLPQSAVLIAERYRQKFERIITDIMRSSPHPEVVAQQLPGRDDPITGEEVEEGVSAMIKRPAAMISMNETTRKGWAFGKQERIAEMGRLMAMYDRDVTTQNRRPPAAFQATFLSKEGMRLVKEMTEEDWGEWMGDLDYPQ